MRLRLSVMASSCRNIECSSLSMPVCPHWIQSACRTGPATARADFGPARRVGPAAAQRNRAGTWPRHHVRRGAASTLGALLTAMLMAAAPCVPVGEPDPGDVVAAWSAVRGWVDEFDLPPPGDPAAAVPLRGAAGACVILRQSGRVVGIGSDASGGDGMVRRAAGRALGQVLADPAVAALPREMTASVGRSLTVELEAAGRLHPLLGGTFEAVAGQLDPGLDGVAMRRGEEVVMLFPAQMRAVDAAGRAERLLAGLAADLGLSPLPLAELVRRFDISIYRFSTTDVAQAGPGEPPFPTWRGGTVVPDAQVTAAAIAAFADGIVNHLIESHSPPGEPLGVRGSYHPAADDYEPLVAPPAEQALVAWALLRYAGCAGAPAAGAVAARQAGMKVLDELRRVAPGEDDPFADVASAAAFLLAADEAGDSWTDRDAAESAARRVLALPDEAIAPHVQAMTAVALVSLLGRDARVDAALARRSLDAAWSSVPGSEQVSLLPWIGWAEADYASATGGPIAKAEDLRRLRVTLDAVRMGGACPPDLAGGLALTGTGGDRPNSQTLRPAAYLATMVRDPQFTEPAESPAALGRVLSTARFAIQLSVRDDSAWPFRNPGRALGGIRDSTWEARQPVAAQALGLAFAAETLASMEALARRN